MLARAFGCIVEMVKVFLVMYGVMGFDITGEKKRLAAGTVTGVALIVLYMTESGIMTSLLLPDVIIAFMFFEGRIKDRIKLGVPVWVLIQLIDVIRWLFYPFIFGIEWVVEITQRKTWTYFMTDMVGIVMWGAVVWLLRKSRRNIHSVMVNMKTGMYLMLLVTLLADMFVAGGIQGMFMEGEIGVLKKFVVWVVIILTLMMVIVCMMFVYMVMAKDELDRVNELERQCIDYQRDYYSQIMRKDDELRSFKHDINKHFETLSVLVRQNDAEQTIEYLNGMAKLCETRKVYYTGNEVADYFINGRLGELSDVKIKVNGVFPEDTGIDDIDMCTIWGNVLDNVVRAVGECAGERYITIEILNTDKAVIMSVENSCRGVAGVGTTKQDGENHGYGLRNVERTLKKYEGGAQVDCSREGVFKMVMRTTKKSKTRR